MKWVCRQRREARDSLADSLVYSHRLESSKYFCIAIFLVVRIARVSCFMSDNPCLTWTEDFSIGDSCNDKALATGKACADEP